MTKLAARIAITLFLVLSRSGLSAQDGITSYRPAYKETVHVTGKTESYTIEPGRIAAAELARRFTTEQLALLEKLNRADRMHLPNMRQLVVPDTFDRPEVEYAPLPQQWPSAAQTPKAIVVHLPGQVFGAYEYGRLVHWGPVSSGVAHTPTPPGLYHLNWKSKGRHSTDDPTWYMKWYFNFQNTEGRALHALDMPGYPASHSCIRLLERDARWIYGWGDEWTLEENGGKVEKPGTPVLLVGQYDFDAYYPWRVPQWLARPVELPALPQ